VRRSALATRSPAEPAAPGPRLHPAVAAGCLGALLIGAASAAGGAAGLAAALVALVVLAAGLLPMLRRPTFVRTGWPAVEAPVLLLLLSTLVFRIRDLSSIESSPLDSAGLFRVGCEALAVGLAGVALLTTARPSGRPLRSRPVRLYAGYALTVLLGAVGTSSDPLLTGFYGAEVVAVLLVMHAAVRTAGGEALRRIEALIYWFQVALMASVWVGVAAFPAQAVHHVASPLPWQVLGVYPVFAANAVGTLGASMAIWSLARLLTPAAEGGPNRLVSGCVALVGFATLVAAQYRTGYVGFAVALVLLLLLRGRRTLATAAVAAGIVIVALGPSVGDAQPFLLRGDTPQQAEQLNSRLEWWTLAVPVWRRSPVIGGGLLTATRVEILDPLGRGDTSTIHSTWVEVLVGTGLVGLAFLGSAFLVLMWRSLREALSAGGRVVPFLVMTVIAVRSFTGTTFEASGRSAILFLAFAFALGDRRWDRWAAGPVRAVRARR
jgi:O-antigen ligase